LLAIYSDYCISVRLLVISTGQGGLEQKLLDGQTPITGSPED